MGRSIIIHAESNGGYVVVNPLLSGCYSQGETVDEALTNIKQATLLCLEEECSEWEKASLDDMRTWTYTCGI